MTPDSLFRNTNLIALSSWVLLLGTGWSPRASRWIASLVTGLLIPALLSIIYLALFILHWHGHPAGAETLSDVMLLFHDPWVMLAGWVHYLAFDLFVGSWEARDALRRSIPFWLVVPCLVGTFLCCPLGFLLYLVISAALKRGGPLTEMTS